MKFINSEFGLIPWEPDAVRIRHRPPQKEYHKKGYWKDWYWNKGGRERVQAQRKVTEYIRYKKELLCKSTI